MLTIRPVRYGDLTAEQIAQWGRLQQADPAWRSPNFRPEFVRIADSVREGVEVALFERDGVPVGFFPFERLRNQHARPVAGILSDFHGAVVAPSVDWTPDDLMRGCRLKAIHFDHLIDAGRTFARHHWNLCSSPAIDLHEEFDAYCARLKSTGGTLKKLRRRMRKLEQEAGPVRYSLHSEDPAVFEALLQWKQTQYRASGLANILGAEWAVELLRRVLAEDAPEFRGLLMTLHAGDALLSIDLCIASGGVLQSWFPAYNRDFAWYSPGLLHLLETVRHGRDNGFRYIELGKGSEDYKFYFANSEVLVAEGSVGMHPVARWCRRTWHGACNWLKSSRLRPLLKSPARAVRRFAMRAALE